jgi:hypothetical protein
MAGRHGFGDHRSRSDHCAVANEHAPANPDCPRRLPRFNTPNLDYFSGTVRPVFLIFFHGRMIVWLKICIMIAIQQIGLPFPSVCKSFPPLTKPKPWI